MNQPTPTPEAMAAAKPIVASMLAAFRQLGHREEKPETITNTELAFAKKIDAAHAPLRAELEKARWEVTRLNELIEADTHSQISVFNRAIVLANSKTEELAVVRAELNARTKALEEMTTALRNNNEFLLEDVYRENHCTESGGPEPADEVSLRAIELWRNNDWLITQAARYAQPTGPKP